MKMLLDASAHPRKSENKSEPSVTFQNCTESMRMPQNILEHLKAFKNLSESLISHVDALEH